MPETIQYGEHAPASEIDYGAHATAGKSTGDFIKKNLGDLFGNMWDKMNPAPLIHAIGAALPAEYGGTGQHDVGPLVELGKAIVNAHVNEFKRAADEWKAGKPGAAATSAAYGAIPVVGPQWDAAAEQIAKGDVAGGVGSMVGIAAPFALGDPGVQSAIGKVAKGTAANVSKTASMVGAGIKAGGPEIAAGTSLAATGAGISELAGGGTHHFIGAPTYFAGGLLMRQGIVKALKAMREAAKPLEPENTIYDDIARGLADGKPYAKLDEAGQATVRSIAEKMDAQAQPAPPSPTPAPPSPTRIDTGPAIPTGKSIDQLLTEELAQRAPAQPGNTSIAGTVNPSITETTAEELARRRQSLASAYYGATGAKPPETAAAKPASPAVTTIPFSQPELPSETYAAVQRAAKAKALARFLYNEGDGIPASEVPKMGPDQWKMAAQGAAKMHPEAWPNGMPEPSLFTQQQALLELKALEKAGPSVAKQLADELTKQ